MDMTPGSGGDPDIDASPPRVGARLRAAREAARMDLGDVSARTRIPVRHLEAIERSDYLALPAPAYATGFARAYARALGPASGIDEVETARDVRTELGREPVRKPEHQPYEPVDPARVPSRLLAWTTFAIAVVFLIGWLVWRNMFFSDTPPQPVPAAPTASVGGPSANPTTPVAAAAPSATGQVVLTATAPVWVEITDATGEKFALRELKQGEAFVVPKAADRPIISTGRPEALRVTIDGREVPPLGEPARTVKKLGISAASLAARAPVGQTPPAANGQGSR